MREVRGPHVAGDRREPDEGLGDGPPLLEERRAREFRDHLEGLEPTVGAIAAGVIRERHALRGRHDRAAARCTLVQFTPVADAIGALRALGALGRGRGGLGRVRQDSRSPLRGTRVDRSTFQSRPAPEREEVSQGVICSPLSAHRPPRVG